MELLSSVANGSNVNTSFLSACNNSMPQNCSELEPAWTVIPVCSLITLILAFFGNTLLLALFWARPILWTPFNIYIINLIVSNLLTVVWQYPLQFITNLYSLSWWMGDRACTVYLYSVFILQGVTGNAHQLIAINRIWAVIHPLSYRSHHSFRIAIALNIGMWIYVHVCMLPGWILDAQYYRGTASVEGCNFNVKAQPGWMEFIQLVVYDWPIVVMALALLIIWSAKRLRRMRIGPLNNKVYSTEKSINSREKPVRSAVRRTSVELSLSYAPKPEQPPIAEMSASDERTMRSKSARKKPRARGHLILILLTISFLITWIPMNTYFTMTFYSDDDWPMFYEVATVLASLQPVIDPILFALAVGSVRNEIRQIFEPILRRL